MVLIVSHGWLRGIIRESLIPWLPLIPYQSDFGLIGEVAIQTVSYPPRKLPVSVACNHHTPYSPESMSGARRVAGQAGVKARQRVEPGGGGVRGNQPD